MLIETFNVVKLSETYWQVDWTATDLTKTCWLFANGLLVGKYFDGTTYERSAEVSVERDRMVFLEIHEAVGDDPETTPDETEPVASITTYGLQPYVLRWDRVSDAVYYRIYHREAEGSESTLTRVYQDNVTEVYEYTLPELNDIGGVWHHFRVESVNEWELASEREQWHFFAYGLPPQPESVTVNGGGGIFALRVDF